MAALVSAVLVPSLVVSAAVWIAADQAWFNPGLIRLQAELTARHADTVADCSSWQEAAPRDGRCVWNGRAGGAPVYLVGDSKAGHLSEAVIGATAELGRPVTISTASAGPDVVIHLDQVDPPEWWTAAGCRAAFDKSASWLAEAEPGLVIMSSKDVYALSDSCGISLDGDGYITDMADKSGVHESALVRTVKALEDAGHSVLLVHPGPRIRDWNPQACNTLSILSGGCAGSTDLRTLVEGDQPLTRAINAAALATGSGVVDIRPVLCPEGSCSTTLPDGSPATRDGSHISVAASQLHIPLFSRSIAAAGAAAR
jgi:hypothetical protein